MLSTAPATKEKFVETEVFKFFVFHNKYVYQHCTVYINDMYSTWKYSTRVSKDDKKDFLAEDENSIEDYKMKKLLVINNNRHPVYL